MNRIVIIGATSAIAEQCARLWASSGAAFFIVGRNTQKLDAVKNDLIARGAAQVTIHQMDANDHSEHERMVKTATDILSGIDIVLLAHGTLPNQILCEQNPEFAIMEFETNAVSTIALLTRLGPILESQKHGTIAVISSVAGDRGRPSNYLYGSAKGAVSIFCQGLRARLHKSGANVLTVKPGFVDTPMTRDLKLPALLVTSPARVAGDIVRAVEKRQSVIYSPPWWRAIMLIIKLIPEAVFRRMKL
ncbi:MAG: SDR family oxidoreductase [Micropepsaceae bacterium]